MGPQVPWDYSSYHQFKFHSHCYLNSCVTKGSIYLPFNRLNRTDHNTGILYVCWDYHFISMSQGTINHNISLTFTFSSVIKYQLSQMSLHVFPPTDQIEVTRLQKPPKSPGTIISSPYPT